VSKWRSATWRAISTNLSDVRVTSGSQHDDYLAFAARYDFVNDKTDAPTELMGDVIKL